MIFLKFFQSNLYVLVKPMLLLKDLKTYCSYCLCEIRSGNTRGIEMHHSLRFAQIHLRAPNTRKFFECLGYGFDAMLTGHSADLQFCFFHSVMPLLEKCDHTPDISMCVSGSPVHTQDKSVSFECVQQDVIR